MQVSLRLQIAFDEYGNKSNGVPHLTKFDMRGVRYWIFSTPPFNYTYGSLPTVQTLQPSCR